MNRNKTFILMACALFLSAVVSASPASPVANDTGKGALKDTSKVDSKVTVRDIKLKKARVDSLEKEIAAKKLILSQEDTLIKNAKDSLKRLTERDSVLRKSIAAMEISRNRADTCFVYLSVKLLLMNGYNKEYLDVILPYFKHRRSPAGANAFLEPLLDIYDTTFVSIRDILWKAQNDVRRYNTFPKQEADFRYDYTEEIFNLPYYERFYGKDWHIPWLDKEVIGPALNMLSAHTGREPADFMAIINKLGGVPQSQESDSSSKSASQVNAPVNNAPVNSAPVNSAPVNAPVNNAPVSSSMVSE